MSENAMPSSTLIHEYMKNAEELARKNSKQVKYKAPFFAARWVPYACIFSLAVLWIPDHLKIDGIRMGLNAYGNLQFAVHKAYWRWTMDPKEYETLMKQIEANVPKKDRVDSPDCPL